MLPGQVSCLTIASQHLAECQVNSGERKEGDVQNEARPKSAGNSVLTAFKASEKGSRTLILICQYLLGSACFSSFPCM